MGVNGHHVESRGGRTGCEGSHYSQYPSRTRESNVTPPHPAKFSATVLGTMATCLIPGSLVLDPFAGTGLRPSIPGIRPVCVEIEPDWATQVCAAALRLPFRYNTFDAIATSPTYGNRMADHHNAKDSSKRHTYTHYIGHKLNEYNSGQVQWGPT